MLVYATQADYETAYPTAEIPTDLPALLRIASGLVRRATIAAVYDVDSAGKPSDPDVAAAFMEATCAHAYAMDAAGITNPAAGPSGYAAEVVSSSIGSATVTRTQRAGLADERAHLFTGLAPLALDALSAAGVTGVVQTR